MSSPVFSVNRQGTRAGRSLASRGIIVRVSTESLAADSGQPFRIQSTKQLFEKVVAWFGCGVTVQLTLKRCNKRSNIDV